MIWETHIKTLVTAKNKRQKERRGGVATRLGDAEDCEYSSKRARY